MAIQAASINAGIRRASFLNFGGDWSRTFYVKYLSSTPSGGNNRNVMSIWNGSSYIIPYIWIGSNADTNDLFVEVYDGTTFYDSSAVPIVLDQWYFVELSYDSSITRLRVYVNNVQIFNLTIDLSLLTANFTTEDYLQDGTGTWSSIAISYERAWSEFRNVSQLLDEAPSATAIYRTNLQSEAALNNLLTDTSGNGRNFTQVGTLTTTSTNPTLDAHVGFFIGASFRISADYMPNVAAIVHGLLMSPIFIVNDASGQEILQLGFGEKTTHVDLATGIVTSSTMTFRLIYFSSGTTYNHVDVVWPEVDPLVGHVEGAWGRGNWPWIQIELICHTSTYLGGGNYAVDGAIQVKVNGATVINVSGVSIKRLSNPFINNVRFTIWPVIDMDGLSINSDMVYPSYSGPQNVPTSPRQVDYLDFNAGTSGPGWIDTKISVASPNGPVYNLLAGLDGSGGASVSGSDPNTCGATYCGAANHFGGAIQNTFPLQGFNQTVTTPTDVGTIIVSKITLPCSDTTTFAINAIGGIFPANFTLKHGEMQVYNGVPVGSGYDITEVPDALFDTTYEVSNGSPHTNITVASGEIVNVIITNTIKTRGTLTVAKATTPFWPTFSGQINVSSCADPPSVIVFTDTGFTYNNLPSGVYTVSQILPPSTPPLPPETPPTIPPTLPPVIIQTPHVSNVPDEDLVVTPLPPPGGVSVTVTVYPSDDVSVVFVDTPVAPGSGLYTPNPDKPTPTDTVINADGTILEEPIPTPFWETGMMGDL